jgi:hypothetical protein
MEIELKKENGIAVEVLNDEKLTRLPEHSTSAPLYIENDEMSFTDLSNYGRSVLGEESFTKWLITHNPFLKARPVELLMTKEGMGKVLDELMRIGKSA